MGTADTEGGGRSLEADTRSAFTFEPLHYAEDEPSVGVPTVPAVSGDQDADDHHDLAPSTASGHQGTEEPTPALVAQPGVSEDPRRGDDEKVHAPVPRVPAGGEAGMEEESPEGGHVQLQPFQRRSRGTQTEVRMCLSLCRS